MLSTPPQGGFSRIEEAVVDCVYRGDAMRLIRSFPIVAALAMAVSGAGQASAAMLAGVDALKEWNLIVFNNLSSSSEVEGRSFIGGSLSGNSSNYYTQPGNNPSQNGNPGLTVVGNVTGGTKNLNNASGANIGGNLASQNGFNLNGGIQTVKVGGTSTQTNINQNIHQANLGASFTNTLIAQKDLLISSLGSLSDNLAALSNTGTASITNNRLTVAATGSGLNVFSLTLGQFSNFGEISVTNPNGGTVVINVAGASATLADNFVNTASDIGRNVIWNFYEATNLNFNNAFLGTVLAVDAAVSNNNYIEGTLVANSFNQNGEVHMDSFQGDLSSIGTGVSVAPEPGSWAMLILGFGLIGAAMRRRERRSLVLQAA